MLPSLLAKDIQTGLKQFLTAAYEPADPFMHGLMSRFVEDEADWLKGPYLQVGLPFVPGTAGRDFFQDFKTEHPGYSHQERAWQHLSSQHLAANTLVATGTGSGKTECFLYPLLDHCARARKAGEAGVKALVIYPMNALATDQARRIAHLVAAVPAFAGLRVGLYVGGNGHGTGEGMVMTPASVITDRETLRKQPPDILLTNYKMLDYLMLRPKDRELWAANTPTTLRYVVVDELHTFDGAQGTDLALLLRRLRARLKIDPKHLICAGTSATLGNASDTAPLREYARQVFGVPFEPESVVTENRQSVDLFLEDATVDYMFLFRPECTDRLEPARYASPAEAVAAWFGLFFPDEASPSDVTAPTWRLELGLRLKRHQLFVNLLKLLKGGVAGYQQLVDAFARNMPAASATEVRQVIDALLVLVAWAQREGKQSLVTLRVQLWVRELRRMVGKLATDPAEVKLRSERDLPAERDGVYLPMVQCSQCRTTGWISRLVQGSNKLSTNLEEIYNTWFSRRPEAARLYAAQSIGRPQVDGIEQHVCVACGNVQQGNGTCLACGHQDLLAIFRVTAQQTQVVGQAQYTRHDQTCPACGERGELLLLGARNATLGSQVVESSWTSIFNDDKKLIAFSDSVQDAAHRAGFFGARTYLNNVRTAWAHVMDELGEPCLPWSTFLTRAEAQFDNPSSILHMDAETLVSEFLGPNMAWQHDWAVELLQHQHLPTTSRLPAKVRKRLLWQLISDLTYLSQRGRTLERIGKAVLAVPWTQIDAIAGHLLPALREQFGAHGLEQSTVGRWLWGMLTHMRQRGGVMHLELMAYAADGNIYALAKTGGRGEWLPKMGESTPRPVFLTLGKQRDFDKLIGTTRQTWYERWTTAILGQQTLLAKGMAADMCQAAINRMLAEGLLIKTVHHQGDTLAINPEILTLFTQVAFVATAGNQRRLAVPREDAMHLLGIPCLDAQEVHYEALIPEAADWWAHRFSRGDLRRVIAAEHTGLLERPVREALEIRFKHKQPKPWFENLLSATPTLEMGVDIGDLSSVLLCSVPPNQASFLQRVGRAGRRDGNAMTTTLADGNSPHDLYFFAETEEMMAGEVAPPGVFLQAAEVLRRQLFAFCMDDWVASLSNPNVLPEKTSLALDALETNKQDRFPYLLRDYVLTHEVRLFDAFMQLLADDMNDVVHGRLLDYMQGQGESDGLRTRLMKSLEELLEERKTYKKRKDELDKAIKHLRQKPLDDATKADIDNLLRERDKLLELIKEINSRDLLGTLTDAGLIPNYAFPEAGVELKSVLWRKRGADEPGQGAYVTLHTLKYERPAQSALSEFAPENRFYANQRRVEVDQINMNLARAEDWRLCPACHHMQNLAIEPDVHAVCPRCGDAMWGDAAQRRTLLRFRQAIANSNDTDVRIDDSADDREPKYYVRQLMADFQSNQVREAWQIGSGTLPFGFEFISRVTFRDVNFGEIAKPGETFKVADKETARPGFRLCRHCGKVQKPPKRGTDSAEQTHAFDCPKHGNNDPANLLECLYLYREFESEALRILVPYTKNGVDGRVVQSFMAALQLGLKRRFGGKVDHLRMVLQDEPGKNGGPRKHYVMLYDSVPGGTGYLHQLLAHDAGTLADVLRMALEAVMTCSCNTDPEKDGCYRCLYQYRLGRNMEQVSRDNAKAVLTELVCALGQLERVDTISDIYINPNFDSVLEARFIESLKRLGGVGGLPAVKLVQDVVNGKSGWVLEVGTQRYRIEPQCELGKTFDLSVWSKPDFVIWPWSVTAKRKPIAVFCDGWTDHQHGLREDALKRSAIVSSGQLWVWSVTHDDVKAALNGSLDSDLESPLVALSRHDGSKAPAHIPRAQEKAFTQNAVARLLNWLAIGNDGAGNDAALPQLQRNALWLGFLMIPSTEADKVACTGELAKWRTRLPEYQQEPGPGFAPSLAVGGQPCTFLGWWPMVWAKPHEPAPGWSAPGVVILDEAQASDGEMLHHSWRRWLQLANATQFLPGMLMVTGSGLDAHDYDGFAIGGTPSPVGPAATGQEAQLAVWQAVLEQTLGELKDGLKTLALAGAALPEVGLELADAKGRVLADAELAWAAAMLAVLRPDQTDLVQEWKAAGWQVIELDESLSLAEEKPWALTVAAALGLTLKNME
ncbi:DEAD/DEAH box helicase [Chromobacterium phragmitis]|uniref:DEAD/DEAH box helicase n=1 Tax=Chromobacterium phragmitis TaxID=2202141 RepID=A0A344UH99_9NEIS|nr:DEAD/DEAH box helicase [Chromobacterium phragmitis]AXE34647.1 DEAD/DEAH box helicase [Chromobacterium phragmitis]